MGGDLQWSLVSIKITAAVKNSKTRTALPCSLLRILCSKEQLYGRRLYELDQDVIEAITDFPMEKLKREPPPRKRKEGEEKPPSPVSRSAIKQATRVKCNTVISLQKKTGSKES